MKAPKHIIAGSVVVALAMVLAFWQFALGGIPWLAIPGADALLPGTPVELATYSEPDTACYTNAEPYLLVRDPVAGVAMVTGGGGRVPVAWPGGFRGRAVGDEVLVYSPSGVLAAETGRWWYIAAEPNAESNPNTVPFHVGCAWKGLTEWDPNSTPPPG